MRLPCMLCEKCIALRARDAVGFPALKNDLPDGVAVWIIDHYLLLWLVMKLFAHTKEWLGQVRRVQVTLFETKGVPPSQLRSHCNGMTGFFYHVVGLGGLWLNLNELVPLDAAWSKHPDEEVPDTYRWGRFGVAKTGAILEGAAGKRMPKPERRIYVEGDKGHAVIDRDLNELRVNTAGRAFSIFGPANDTGYASLIGVLANGLPLPPLHNPTQAVLALHLVEASRAIAREVSVYAETKQATAAFVSDSQLVPEPIST